MSTRQLLISDWDWEPSVVIGCACLLAIYFAFARARSRKNAACFLGGVLVMLLALVSPIDTLGDTYLFSAHMLQHLLLMLVVPPLLLLGIPELVVRRVLEWPLASTLERTFSKAAPAWSLATVSMAFWHLPFFYNAALANEAIHIVQHFCFLVTATIFWWPLLTPIRSRRLATPVAIVYLFLAIMANTVLAAAITFAPAGLYPAYLAPHDELGILSLIRDQWGISPQLDQQLGGLLMWVPGCGIYLWAILLLVVQWLTPVRQEDDEARRIEDSSSMVASGRSKIA